MTTITLDAPLNWREVAQIAEGARLELSSAAIARMANARQIVDSIVDRDIRGYGINTGVGALCNTIVDRSDQSALSHNILMSHACGVGTPLKSEETRAIMAAMINTFSHGYSGVRPVIAEMLCAMLNNGCTPVVPSAGSVGYLSHAAAISLILIGEGTAAFGTDTLTGQQALMKMGQKPLTLQAKEGLSLVNGTSCSTGLSALAVFRAEKLLNWGNKAAAATFEAVGGHLGAFDQTGLGLRKNVGVQRIGAILRELLARSGNLTKRAGLRTQDCLSLRAIPQVHGALYDTINHVGDTINDELASITDNPSVMGTPQNPQVFSQANAVGASIALAMDNLSTACALFAGISERRTDRMINPLVSGLPAFLAPDGGVFTGFQVVQLTALSLSAECRRLAAPVSLNGGISAALQEDALTHATPAALNTLRICENIADVISIELLTAVQALRLLDDPSSISPKIKEICQKAYQSIPPYKDQHPISDDIQKMRDLVELG
ncbi:MAG: HAL/PAL/TAL family ammonia-lyase [Cognatishimia sp.]